MADLNIPVDIAHAEQAPAIAPPTRTDDQILPSSKWVPIGKSNSVLDVQKSQRNPIFSIAVAILKNTNFFRIFTASSTIPAIYSQQFWDTMCFNSSTGFTLRNVSAMSVNALYQPWRAILSMINMCLTGKTAGFDRPRHLVLQILWDITHHSNIDYAEWIGEEFVQSIQTFLTDRKNLATEAREKKKTLHLLIPNVRFTKLIIHHLKTKHIIHPRTGSPLHYLHEESILNTLRFVGKDGREVFGMPIHDALLTDEITSAPYYSRYLEHVAKCQRCLDKEHGKAEEEDVIESPKAAKATKSKTAKQTKLSAPKASKVTTPPKPTPTTTEPSKKDQSKKCKLVKETSDAPSPVKRSKAGKGKGKEKVSDEQVALDLLTLQTPKKKSPTEQYIFQRRTPTTTKPSGHAESPSLYAELGLINSETESDEEVSPEINAGTQDEGQAGPNPGDQDEGQVGPNPGIQDEGHAGSNLDQVRLEEPASSAGTLSSLQNLDKELSFTNQFLMDKSQEDEPDKSNTKAEVQSMVTVPIYQDTSSVPLMTTPVIDLTMSQPVSTTVQAPLPTSIATITAITTTTSLPPPLPQPQQSTADPILVCRIVDWAMQAPLRARFRDLPTVDIKEILQQRMFEDDSYKTNNVHKALYESLQKSLELDYSNQRLADQEEARKKRRKRRASGSSQLLPPPPPLSIGTSGSTPQQGHEVPSSSKTTASAQQSMAWTTSDTRYESTGIAGAQELSSSDDLMHDDSVPDKQWNPLPKEERPATPEPAWTILPSNVSDVENNWASVLALSYEPPAENSLLTNTGDMTTFLNWYCRQINKSKLTQADLEGQAYVSRLTGRIQKEIKSESIFGNNGSMPVLSISKMKAARYPDFGLELLVPEQIWIEDVCTYDISAKYGIAHCVVRIKAYSRYGYDYLSEIVLRRADFQEHTIAIKDFKNLYPSNFEDLNLLLLQGHLDHLSGSDKQMLSTAVKLWTRNLDATVYDFKHDYTIIESPRAVIFPVNNNERKIMRFNEIYKFSDGTLTRILETLDYRVKEFKIKRLNLGMNTRFWTEKGVTRSKEFITAIERRLKTRRIYWNLECFVGGRVRDIDYRLLQRTE
ncbi:hypothetical protein Tco_1360872 [Tanacetum coccineum]